MLVAAALWLQSGSFGQSAGLTNVFVFKRGAVAPVRDQAVYVLSNENEFSRYWGNNQYGKVPTGIDWLRQMVVAVHLGQRPNAGYELELGNTEVRNSQIWLHMRERLPGEGLAVSQVRTSPWMIVRLDRTAWEIKTDFTQLPARDTGVFMPNGSTQYKFGNTTVIVPPSNYGLTDLGWSDYYSGYDCGRSDSGYVVFDSGEELRGYWVRTLTLDERLAPSVIDWQNEKVVAIHLGRRPSSGYQAVVTAVKQDGKRGVIFVKEIAPDKPQGTRSTRPYMLVRVDRSIKDWRVEFQK